MNDTGPRMAIFTYNEAWIDEEDKSTTQFIERLKAENKIRSRSGWPSYTVTENLKL